MLLRVYAAAIFGMLTANIASYLVGRHQEERAGEPQDGEDAHRALLAEMRQLRAELRGRLPDEGGRANPPSPER